MATEFTDEETGFRKAKEEITEHVRNALIDYAILFDENDVDAIVQEFDVRQHISENRSSYRSSSGYSSQAVPVSRTSESEEQQIDDLFERDQ